MSTSIFARLSIVYQLLSNRSKRFRFTANECRDIYIHNNASLFQDLLKYPRINKDMLTFLFVNYSFSNSIKALVLDDLNRLLLIGKFEVIIRTFERMIECGIVSSSVENEILHLRSLIGKLPDIELREVIANIIANQAIRSGEHMLASSFVLGYKASNIPMYSQTICLLLRALAIDTTNNHVYNSYTIIKILDEFSINIVTLSDICDLLLYLSEGKQAPFFANVLFNLILKSSVLDDQKDTYLRKFFDVCIELIQKNIEHGNITRATKIWNSIKNFESSPEKSGLVLNKIITRLLEMNEELAEKFIIENLATEAINYPDLNDCILKFFGTHSKYTENFESLIKHLRPPLRRLTLSLLFEIFLLQNNESGAERILLSIFKSKNGINYLDFDFIISKLIKQQKLGQCIDMLKSTNIEISKRGYISVLEYFLKTPNSKEGQEFLEDMTLRFCKLKADDECLGLLTRAFFNHISKSINNRISRSLFTNIIRNSQQNTIHLVPKDELNIGQYFFPKEFLQLLSLAGDTRHECLKIISKYAVRDHDLNTLRWCVEEMRFSGVLLEDILDDIHGQDSLFFKEVFRAETLPYLFQH